MKKLIIFLLTLTCLMALASCEVEPLPIDPNMPAGAIALTAENIGEYYDIKVTADCVLSYDTEYDKPECISTAYVALVPRGNYLDALGEITYDVNCEVYSHTALFNRYRIVNTEQSQLIRNEIVNESYTTRTYTSDEYHPDFDTNTITIKSVTGYVVPGGTADTDDYDDITESQRSESPDIRAELEERLDEFKILFDLADNYNYHSYSGYVFTSLYGEGMSASGGAKRYGVGTEGAAVDITNRIIINSDGRYFVRDGVLYEQVKNDLGLVEQRALPRSFDEMIEYRSTVFDDVIDPSAIYIMDGLGVYAAYVPLTDMKEGEWKDEITEKLDNYGITTGLDKFIVRYEYAFDGTSFAFDVVLTHKDIHYPVHFVDISAYCGYKISDVNNVKTEIYTPDNSTFALSETLEDAMKFNFGMIEVSGASTNIFYINSNGHDRYYGDPQPDHDNFLPINITEGGVYIFRDESGSIVTSILDSDGEWKSGEYYTPGIYYIKDTWVKYGVTSRMLTVEATILKDYGDLKSPTVIENGALSCHLECSGDRVVYSYTPDKTGFYQLTPNNEIYIVVYADGDFESDTGWICTPYMSAYFEAGKEYILSVQHRIHPGDAIDYDTDIVYVGDVGDEVSGITAGSDEKILLGNGSSVMYIDVTTVGEYTVENINQNGESVYAYFCDEDGKRSDLESYENADGENVYFLAPGRYYYYVSVSSNEYFLGEVMLTLVTEGVGVEENILLDYEEYTVLTTAVLPTKYSYTVYYFEVEEICTILLTVDSDNCAIFTEDGDNVMHTVYPTYMDGDVEVTRYRNVKPGRYYILVENSTGEAREYTISLKLQKKEN